MHKNLENHMKIGQFATKHQTSIDTIRHYMSLGLLIPEKVTAQYDFDETCSHDFLEIMELKKLGFHSTKFNNSFYIDA
jgi:DNA-binding transcriptional MerR regulator